MSKTGRQAALRHTPNADKRIANWNRRSLPTDKQLAPALYMKWLRGIAEVLGVKDDRVELQDLFIFDRTGVTDAGKVQGRFRSTGVTPKILDRLRIGGIQLSPSVFDEVLEVNM